MKYFVRVLTVLVIVVAIIFGVYYATNGVSVKNPLAQSTTMTKQAVTEKHGNRKLLASIEEEKIYLYVCDDVVILDFKGNEYEYTDWGKAITLETPELHYTNFDGDAENELVIKAVDSVDEENNGYNYNIYYFDPTIKDGKDDFVVSLFSRNTWISQLNSRIVVELGQVQGNDKIVQFAMEYAGTPIEYDKQTGIATNEHVGFFRALKDSNGNYMKVDKWSRGFGVYSINDDNKICIDVPIIVSYKNSSETQLCGTLSFRLQKGREKDEIIISPKSLYFIPNEDYKVSNPRDYEKSTWSYIENNSNKTVNKKDTVIDWISYDMAFDASVNTQTIDFSRANSDINGVESIKLTEKAIVLTAKKGYTFSDSAKKGEYTVIINKNEKDNFEISRSASVSTDKSGKQILTINLDKAYKKSEIKTIQINYGTR